MEKILILRNGLNTIRKLIGFISIFIATVLYAESIVDNQSYDMTAITTDPLWVKSGGGSIISNTIVDDLKVTRDTWAVGGSNNFLIETVMNSALGAAGTEAGARIWIRAHMDDLISPNQYHDIQVRLIRAANDEDNFIGLYDQDGNLAQTSGGSDAKIILRWDQTSPSFRIRLMRQGNEIILEAEPSNVFDDDISKKSISVPLNILNFPPVLGPTDLQEVGFGNGKTSGNAISTWESIHITETDSATTVLPYWPPEPPASILNLTTTVPPHTVTSEVDLSGYSYLVNDAATLALNTLSGELTSTPILDPSTPPAQHTETFTGLDADQTVTGWVEVADVSGRTTLSTQTQLVIPGSGVSALECVGFESPMNGDPVTVKKNRVLPLKAKLFDTGGYTVTDAQIVSPPVIQVLFDDNIGGVDPVDVSDDALPAGLGTDGNQFVFTDDGIWQFNLKTKNYSAPGKYTIIMGSGDESEYTIDPTCETSFVIE